MIAKQRVLVVDDEEIVRESFRIALTEAGYTVRTAVSGHEALEACREEACDVMLADLKMPDMDGLEVTRAVSSEFPDVRVVIVTGYPSPDTYHEATELGIMDYLEKPISPERLSAATATALARPRPSGPPAGALTESPLPVESADVSTPEKEADSPACGENEADDSVDRVQSAMEPTAATTVEPITKVPAVQPEETTEVSAAKALAMLALAPVMGLAFVVFLPLIGFGMLFAAVGSVFGDKIGIARN